MHQLIALQKRIPTWPIPRVRHTRQKGRLRRLNTETETSCAENGKIPRTQQNATKTHTEQAHTHTREVYAMCTYINPKYIQIHI